MRIAGKEINDECFKCGNILECELFRQGHGIKQERENIAKMIKCQMKHREEREKADTPFYDESVEIAKYHRQHQSDCITINQLQTALDVIVDRYYANLRKVHGVN